MHLRTEENLPSILLLLADLICSRTTKESGDENMFNRTTTKVNLLVFIAIFIIYMFLGAQLFSTIERPSEELIIQQMIQTRKSFLEKYPCVQGASEEE